MLYKMYNYHIVSKVKRKEERKRATCKREKLC